ncbi:MAG: ChbG/HpnK family deacetylase [Bryobacteraceae bacterium]
MKRLIVNADDFGFTTDVNRGIIEARTTGVLTATTLMANGPAFEDAVRLAKDHPDLDVGCHLVLVGGPSLLGERSLSERPGQGPRALPRSIPQLLQALALRRLDIYAELRAQVEKILAGGIVPTHLDTHKHTHLLPQVLEAVVRLSAEYRIRWIRRPFDFPLSGGAERVPWLKRATSRSVGGLRARFHAVVEKHGCRTTDHFAGFQLTGQFRTRELILLLRSLPEGTTEFMCHPGRCTEELMCAKTRLKESREEELRALTDPAVREVLLQENIQLTSYREL